MRHEIRGLKYILRRFRVVQYAFKISYPDQAYEARPKKELSFEEKAFGTTILESPESLHF